MIAICIPTYNQSRFLPLAVDSALAQRDVMVDVWVADDCSTDETPKVMAAYAGNPRVHYHRQLRNIGIAANASWVLAQPQTEFLVRLDSDDLLAPEYCADLAAALQIHPRVAVAHAAVQEIDQTGHFRRVRRLSRSAGAQDADVALREGSAGYRVSANVCMFRRTALRSAPCYRPDMNFCEDWDLFLRLADAGWGNFYSDRVLASYRVWSDVSGYRRGRKVIEIMGIRRVFEDTLEPAFRSRGWSPDSLVRARRQLACGQVRSLRRLRRESEDYLRIVDELMLLGDGIGLRIRLALMSLGCGALLDVSASLQFIMRRAAKNVLFRLRTAAKN